MLIVALPQLLPDLKKCLAATATHCRDPYWGLWDCDVGLWCFSKVEHIGAEEGFSESVEVSGEAGQRPQKRRE